MVVVIQAPVHVDSHAADDVGLDRDKTEQRWSEITALMRRPYARRLQSAGVAVGILAGAANQIGQPEFHFSPAARASPAASIRKTGGIPAASGWRRRGDSACRKASARPQQ